MSTAAAIHLIIAIGTDSWICQTTLGVSGMTSKHNRKRKRKKSERTTRQATAQPSGMLVIGLWVATTLLIGSTSLWIYFELRNRGHSHIHLLWIMLLLVLTLITIVYTIDFFRFDRSTTR